MVLYLTRVARLMFVPLVVGLIPLFWAADATYRASLTTLGRDQGIFQYVAWAIAQGDVDYRDVRDVNGPLVHLIHRAFLVLGGADEHVFRTLDLIATGIAFAVTGLCLPGLASGADEQSASGSRPGMGRRSRRDDVLWQRVAWGFAAWSVLAGQYQHYLSWNQAQRESFCDWFLFPSIGLMLLPAAVTARGAQWRIVAIFALSAVTWFAKPSFVLFTVGQFVVLLFDRDTVLGFVARIRAAILGGLVGSIVPIVYLLRWGDVRAFARITFHDVPTVYRFMWAKSTPEMFSEEGGAITIAQGIACSLVVIGFVLARWLPRRALAVAVLPLAGVANVIVQHKGFGYHYHPLSGGTWLGWLVLVVMLVERTYGDIKANVASTAGTGEQAPWPPSMIIAMLAGMTLGFAAATFLVRSPQIQNVWILAGGATQELREDQEYFDRAKTIDFFPYEMRQAAAFLATRTSASDRVQTYGMDPYMLFLAKRRSATPYIYVYDLNADAALAGGWSNEPNDQQSAAIRQLRDAHEADLFARLRQAPPAAFVFIDRSPLMTYADALEDFTHACRESAAWVQAHYAQARAFGPYHIWLRVDPPGPS